MKKNSMIILVAFVLAFTTLFAYNFVQGEESTLVSEVEVVENDVEIKMTEAQYISSLESESIIEEQEILAIEKKELILSIKERELAATRFNEVKEFEEKLIKESAELEVKMDNQVQKILELTPLDERTAKIVLEYAYKYNFEPSLILGMMDLESSFNQYLVGTSQDRGYLQIIPGTEKWLATTYGEELGLVYNPENIFDAEYNIALSVKFIDLLREDYGNNYTMILTAYNRGAGGLRKWYREHGTYETAYSRVTLKRAEKYISVN